MHNAENSSILLVLEIPGKTEDEEENEHEERTFHIIRIFLGNMPARRRISYYSIPSFTQSCFPSKTFCASR